LDRELELSELCDPVEFKLDPTEADVEDLVEIESRSGSWIK